MTSSSQNKLKVSIVSYLNSLPFLYGLQNGLVKDEIVLSQDIPSVCAQKLKTGEVDVGLVPVALLPQLDHYEIISDYCIGAAGAVKSVLLLSDVELKNIRKIKLDYQSLTSVNLVKVLAKKFWNIQPEFENATEGYEEKISGTTAGLVIGDRTFSIAHEHPYVYDLSLEWQKYTGLPFVFACWTSRKKCPDDFLKKFNESLEMGLQQISSLAKSYLNARSVTFNAEEYLTKNISYPFDEEKKKALERFLDELKEV